MAQFNKEDLDRESAQLRAQRKEHKKHETQLKKAERRNKKEQNKLARQKARNLLRDNGYSGRVLFFNKKPYEVVFEEQTVYAEPNLLPAQNNLLPVDNKKPKKKSSKSLESKDLPKGLKKKGQVDPDAEQMGDYECSHCGSTFNYKEILVNKSGAKHYCPVCGEKNSMYSTTVPGLHSHPYYSANQKPKCNNDHTRNCKNCGRCR